jgi:hypothetical protein
MSLKESIIGIFKDESNEIDYLQTSTDIIYDFHLESDNLGLIMSKLVFLPNDFWIPCQIIYMIDNTISVRLLFTNLSPKIHLKIYVKDSKYLLAGNLKNFLSLKPADKMIGISFISVELLLQKIITWINEQDSLSDVIESNDLFDSVEPYLSDKDLLKMRLVSKRIKEMIDQKMIENKKPLLIYQSNLPEDFEYTPESFQTLCARYGREQKDCSLHIVYELDPKGVIIKPLFDRTVLAECDIKLSIKIITVTNPYVYYDDQALKRALFSIVEDLQNTIYSLEIDMEPCIIEDNKLEFDVVRKIPNLKILKLSNTCIRWKPFLDVLKSMTTLEELHLLSIDMFTDVRNHNYDSDEEEEFDVENFINDFRNTWSESLKHLKGLRIDRFDSRHKSSISYNENYTKDELELVETILPCLQDFTELRSFGCMFDRTYGNNIEHFIQYLPYLTKLTKIDFSGSNFDEPESLAIILGALPNLTELNLSMCHMDMRFFEIILPAIQNLRMLKSLDISNNKDFYPENIRRIKTLFKNLVFLDTHVDGEDLDSLE